MPNLFKTITVAPRKKAYATLNEIWRSGGLCHLYDPGFESNVKAYIGFGYTENEAHIIAWRQEDETPTYASTGIDPDCDTRIEYVATWNHHDGICFTDD